MSRKKVSNRTNFNPCTARLLVPCNFDELLVYVVRYTGRKVGDRALRFWFKHCGVEVKAEYEWFDLAKLVVFGQWLNRYKHKDRSGADKPKHPVYEWASDKLVEEILKDKEFFFPQTNTTTIEVRSEAA